MAPSGALTNLVPWRLSYLEWCGSTRSTSWCLRKHVLVSYSVEFEEGSAGGSQVVEARCCRPSMSPHPLGIVLLDVQRLLGGPIWADLEKSLSPRHPKAPEIPRGSLGPQKERVQRRVISSGCRGSPRGGRRLGRRGLHRSLGRSVLDRGGEGGCGGCWCTNGC